MFKKLQIIFLFLAINVCSQNSVSIPDSLINESTKNFANKTTAIAATCAAPSGTMASVIGTPPSYAWLQTNGYCRPASYGSSGTVCWSFIPTGNSITINSGYSSTGCANISFGPFNLFTCAPACANMGSGLTFAVTPGQCYTWCMGYSGNGGGCSFNDFCPYYQQTTILPIELLYFAGFYDGNINMLQWSTATERDNDFFVLEVSYDTEYWIEITRIKGAGTSYLNKDYSYVDKDFKNVINYYRLKQVDYDGSYKFHGIIAINNSDNLKTESVVRVTNILGQDVPKNYNGIIFIHYSNGRIIKKVND